MESTSHQSSPPPARTASDCQSGRLTMLSFSTAWPSKLTASRLKTPAA